MALGQVNMCFGIFESVINNMEHKYKSGHRKEEATILKARQVYFTLVLFQNYFVVMRMKAKPWIIVHY